MRAVILAVLVALLARSAPARAQPADVDLERARTLYEAATAAMTDGRYADAARDFAASYQLARDPVLLYKIASAQQKLGRCDVAVTFYRRYLVDAKPDDRFVELTRQRLDECAPPPVRAPASAARATTAASPPPAPIRRHGSDAAWLAVGGALALATTGAVATYATHSAESDIRDLYEGLAGVPPTYTPTTAKRYQDLLDQGHRYEHLAWGAFGLAGACAIGAAILFARGDGAVVVAPVAAPHEAGVAARVRF